MTLLARRSLLESRGAVLGLIAVLALGCAGLLYGIGGDWRLALGYALGVAAVGAIVAVASRASESRREHELDPGDWSVTLAAIARSEAAVAITDRANRLVCANRRYGRWFDGERAPLQLEFPAGARLAELARRAWRDGEAEGEIAEGERARWRLRVERCGRSDDHLLWEFCEAASARDDPFENLDLAGPLGVVLSNAGIEAAVVDSRGIIKQVSAGFAARAAGDAKAKLVGQELVAFLRSEDSGRLVFAREGAGASALTLYQVPLALDASASAQSDSLMLLADAGIGVGEVVSGATEAGSAQLEALLGQLPLGLAMTDADGRLLFANRAFAASAQIAPGELPPFPSDLVIAQDKKILADAVRRHGRGPARSGEIAVRFRHDPEELVTIGLASVRGLGAAAVLLSIADSSEESQLKRQVAQATKMQAVGQLAGGVAHDFNNVLTAIIGTCDLMLLRHTPGDSDYDDIQQIRANSNRAASLTRQLLAFSRQQTLRPEILQLPDVVSEVKPLIERLLGNRIAFKLSHDRNLGPVRADPQQLEQVIMNLAVNARDAIEANRKGQGTITLSTRRVRRADLERSNPNGLPIDDYTVLVVQDTGGGIAPEALPKLFEPFFTTKEMGKGTGLGLSTVYGIVKQSGGFIFAENIPGLAGRCEGARFTVYLPVYRGDMPEQKPAAAKEESSDWSRGGRVLLVEDEDMVRAVAERALDRAGYDVVTCVDGEEGLAAIANGGSFDLVVSDVVMPGMDGPSMARAIRQIAPEIPVLFMSGYAEEQLRAEIDIPNMHFIPKPFSVAQLSEKVNAVMQSLAAAERKAS